MKPQSMIGLIAASFASSIWGADETALAQWDRLFDSATVTSTNLILKNPSSGVEGIVLTLDQETRLSNGFHLLAIYTPVSFTNQKKGFRISEVSDYRSFGGGITTNTMYIALGDKVVRMVEADFAEELWIPKRMDGAGLLKDGILGIQGIVTSTNVTLYLKSKPDLIEQDGKICRMPLKDILMNGLVLTPGQKIRIVNWMGELTFTPIPFKRGQEGFKVISVMEDKTRGVITNTVYIALSNAPMRVGEIDVAGVDEAAVIQKEKAEAEREAKRKAQAGNSAQ